MALLFPSPTSVVLSSGISTGTRTSDFLNPSCLPLSQQRRLKSNPLLARSSRSDSGRDEPSITNPFVRVSEEAEDLFSQVTDEWGEKAVPEVGSISKLADETGDLLSDVTDEWGEKAVREVESVSNLAEETGDLVFQVTDEWGEKGVPKTESISKLANETGDIVSKVTDELGENSEQKVKSISNLADEAGESLSEATAELSKKSVPRVESISKPAGKTGELLKDELGEVQDAVEGLGNKSMAEVESFSKLADETGDLLEDEWGKRLDDVDDFFDGDRLAELKRSLIDTVYGTELGYRASSEVRAEVQELVNQLEALNPTPAPVENSDLLDGNWILLYTAFSELSPLLAAGALPLLNIKNISQSINSPSLSIVNSITVSGPLTSFTFSTSASFSVRSSSRIRVEFKEGILEPPKIKTSLDLPESVNFFGQNISLTPLQQSLNPVRNAVANVSRAISGQPPLKIPIPGQRTSSWLLITYLDNDIRISRGDGGLFVLVKEGSPLLDQ